VKKQLLELPWGTLVDAQKVDAIDVVDLTPAITMLPAGKPAKPRGSHVVAVHSLGKVFMSLPLEADDARALRREVGRLVNRERGELDVGQWRKGPTSEAAGNAVRDFLRLHPESSRDEIVGGTHLDGLAVDLGLARLADRGELTDNGSASCPTYRLT
jgi:hypothetical protein